MATGRPRARIAVLGPQIKILDPFPPPIVLCVAQERMLPRQDVFFAPGGLTAPALELLLVCSAQLEPLRTLLGPSVTRRRCRLAQSQKRRVSVYPT